MKESYNAYVPRDRLLALASATELPTQAAGAVLFADISGFTPLTEAFEAHLGSRLGGEELTRVLNEVYAMLIGEVERMRGSVIGFAGDAITCWFDEDNGLRAVSSALAMQRGMDQFKAIPSPGGGTIALGLKAAATYGIVKRFVVGEDAIQKVDVLAGDPVYRVAVVEHVAERGEVLVDAGIREALGDRASITDERLDEHGKALAWVVESVTETPEVELWPHIDLLEIPAGIVDPWLISAIRKRLGSGMGEFFTELRPATAMFVKFEGIDFEKDNEADQKLDTFFSSVQTIVNTHEGVVHQLTVGDKGSFLYAAFGAPISHEDDTLRAMSVALEICELSKKLNFITAVRVGIARGSTRTGAYGGPSRRTYGVLGDQVNLAARLMGKAAVNEILVSDTVFREANRSYRLLTLPPIRVKGKSEPVAVYRLEGKSTRYPVIDASDGYTLPMIGRQEELQQITQFLGLARDGMGQSVSLFAEVGMGKTRLVAEVLKQAKAGGFKILQGECQTFGTNTLYTPWWSVWRRFFGIEEGSTPQEAEEILRKRLAEIDERLIPRLPLLGPVLNLRLEDNDLTRAFDAKLRRTSLDSLLIDCLRAATAQRPVLIVLEDVQAIDDVSRDLLRTLVQATARLPLMLIIAMRSAAEKQVLSQAEKSLDYVHSIELKEFTEEEAAQLIRLKYSQLLSTGGVLPAEVIVKISERTGGNPFFIDEVMNWMHHQKIDITSVDALEEAELPVSLHSLVLSRMDQLTEQPRITMKVASVIGQAFRAAAVWSVYPELGGSKDVKTALAILSEKDFIEEDLKDKQLAYLFKHVVIHEVAYESLTKQVRERLHEAIGLFMEEYYPTNRPHVLDLLAFHFGRSHNAYKKRKYFLEAGDAAREAYANTAAAGYYESVLPLLAEADRVEVLSNLGRVQEISGDWKEAMESYRQGLELAEKYGKELDAANCRMEVGDLLRKTGSFEEASLWLARAKAEFESLGNEEGLGQVLHSEGTLAAQKGEFDTARERYSRSIEIRRKIGDQLKVASLLGNTGIILHFQGQEKEALEHQEQSLAIRKELNDPWHLGNSYNNLGMVKRYMGDFAGAQASLEEALKMFEKVGERAETANTLTSLAELAVEQHDTGACEAYLLESLRLQRELGNLQGLAFLLEAFASNAFNQERPERCLRLFGAAQALRTSIGAPRPEIDEERIGKIIDQVRQSLQGKSTEDLLQQGASLPLSTALDFAAGIQKVEF